MEKKIELLKKENAGKLWGATLASKNIRTELKTAFPGIKFSVRSSVYSGGSSITISYTDGPKEKRIKEMTYKYLNGSFNGMIDMYEFESSDFTDTYGGTYYIFIDRETSKKSQEIILEKLLPEIRGNMDGKPTPKIIMSEHGYVSVENGGVQMFNVYDYHTTFTQMFSRMLRKLDFERCPAEKYNPKGLRVLFFNN